jgi:hypothetical protein
MEGPGFIGMAIAVGVTALAGCASTSGARSEPTTSTALASAHEEGVSTMGGMCPAQVPGTTVTPVDVEGGVALAFTTSTGGVAELRQRVHRMAEMHDRQAGGPGVRMDHGMTMPAATASAEDIEGGARLVLKPKDPSQLEALRQHAQMHARMMARGECPMMAPRGDSTSSVAPPPSPGDAEHESHHVTK